jgi:hypothetical protein
MIVLGVQILWLSCWGLIMVGTILLNLTIFFNIFNFLLDFFNPLFNFLTLLLVYFRTLIYLYIQLKELSLRLRIILMWIWQKLLNAVKNRIWRISTDSINLLYFDWSFIFILIIIFVLIIILLILITIIFLLLISRQFSWISLC